MRHHGQLGTESLDMLGFALEKLIGISRGKYALWAPAALMRRSTSSCMRSQRHIRWGE